jgi:Holliday junction DNA helicase RuvA
MILDLKGKLQDVIPSAFPNLFTPEEEYSVSVNSKALEEAVEALKVLGYAEREIQKVMPALMKENLSTEQYIKLALQKLLK